jgi:two-component system CheB/CheR fusion protein
MLMQVPAAIMLRRGPELRVEFQNAFSAHVLDQRGKTLRESWPDTDAAWLAQFERVTKHGETVVDIELPATRVSDGGQETTRYFDLTLAPWRLPDGTIDGVMTVSFDVTDRVQARRSAAVAEERRRLAFDAADVGTWRIDLLTKLSVRDAPMNRILGLAEVESTQPLSDWLERIHLDDRARVVAAMDAAPEAGSDYVQELRIVRPDGDIRWLRDVGRVVHDELGLPIAFTGATVDITERKHAEDAALAASRAKDEFLAMLGHELRNPLAPIVTALDVMRLRGDPATRERLMIERQVAHLTRLVDDLLDISRVTRGLIELERERVSIRDVVMKAIEIASPLMEQKGHHVDVALPKDLWVDGDPVRLAQVFANLLTNAARYTKAGGKIAIAAQREGDRIRVEVTDTGIGIPVEMLGPIFDLFVQGGRTVARSEGGLGIGLALVRTLVQMHGGEVAAASEGVGKGSTFTVELPALDRAAAVASPTPAPIREVQGLKVLVVDDNVDAAELLGEALRTFGHDVLIAHDGPQALQILDRFQPDAAVLDIGLPVMDGYELAQRLRERGLGSCRLIAVTGYGQKQDIDKSRQAGFHEHMTKPVDLRTLVRALDVTST